MQITDVRIKKVDSHTRVKAVASITFDNCFVVHNIKIIENDTGIFVAMPSVKDSEGKYKDIAHPINSNTRDLIQDYVMNAYNNLLKNEEE